MRSFFSVSALSSFAVAQPVFMSSNTREMREAACAPLLREVEQKCERQRERGGGGRNVMSLRSLLRLASFSPFFASVPSSSSHCVGSFQFIYYSLLQIYWLGNKGKNSIIKQQQQQRNLSARTSRICRTKLRRPWAMKAVCAYWAQRPGWSATIDLQQFHVQKRQIMNTNSVKKKNKRCRCKPVWSSPTSSYFCLISSNNNINCTFGHFCEAVCRLPYQMGFWKAQS